MPSWLNGLVDVIFILSLVYAGLVAAVMLTMLVLALIEGRYRSQQQRFEDQGALARSRFTPTVSILVAAYNEETGVLASVASLLNQNYPEFEVILVDDGSTDNTLALLKRQYDLERSDVTGREPLQEGVECFSSRVDRRLLVLHKSNGGKASAINCALNIAQHRYVCCVDGDTVYVRDALLKAMALIVKDPAVVVGVTSLFGISHTPGMDTGHGPLALERNLLGRLQHLDLMRSFLIYRLAWSKLGSMLCVPGAFAVWRRDVIMESGGFSSEFTCEDIEMTFRIHEKFLREKRPYRIMSLHEMVAQTEGPDNASALVRQRARWQRVTLETVWHYRRMFLRPRYGVVGMLGVPYYIIFEALAPLMQTLSFVALTLLICLGQIDWPLYAAFLGIVVFANAIPSTMAILLYDQAYRAYSVRELMRLLLLGPMDLFVYRPILLYAGLRGSWQFLRGDKGWDKFVRNAR
jgi:cellulose synthase/poly-beta-1,6-N-acetylglucosamine synthase-like glycosyltransferase